MRRSARRLQPPGASIFSPAGLFFFRASLLRLLLHFHTDLLFTFVLFLLGLVLLLAIRSRNRDHSIAFGEVLDECALGSAAENANGTDIDADHDAAGGNNHQIAVAFSNDAGSRDLAGLLVQASGENTAAAAIVPGIFIDWCALAVAILRQDQQFAAGGRDV